MILIRIALRNLASHKLKSIIVGILLAGAAFLLVVGQSLLTTLDGTMSKSVIGSVSGNLQVYAHDAKDKLTLFAGMTDGNDVGVIADFPKVRKVLEAVPGVKSVIPMGIDVAMVFGGNVLDVKLEQLRAAVKKNDTQRGAILRAHVRRMVGLLAKDMERISDLKAKDAMSAETKQSIADVATAGSDAFWVGFDKDPLAAMEYLENKIAPLALNVDMLFFRYMGTDLDRFADNFELFEIVDGTRVPKGQRGFLFNKLTYEEMVKHKTARRLDKMKDRLAEGYKLDTDEDLKQWNKLNKDQIKEITYQLDDTAATAVRAALQKELASKETSMDELLVQFLKVTDQNFAARYKAFYDYIAPHLMLYSVKIGDTMTIKGFTAAGYPTSVNVKVYGTFRFRSLDKSTLAGGMNLMDVMSFRDLYGFLTADRKEELARLKANSKVKAPERDKAEAELFGEGSEEVVEIAQHASPTSAALPNGVTIAAAGLPDAANGEKGFDEFAHVDMKSSAKKYGDDLMQRAYLQADIDSGIVRNAAILFKPDADPRTTRQAVEKAVADQKLPLKVIDWREASGLVGQFLLVIYVVLAVSVFVIFIVAIVIINNSTVMATMERIREIGTLRAIGAQKALILQMFLIEAVVSALTFGGVGVVLGGIVVAICNVKGIPAINDVFVFLFAGPRLHPAMGVSHVVVALIVVTFVTILSTIYPAILAMRVTPLEAMQESE